MASNERIPLTPTMRLIFEIGDLKTATPATVSRAGILFLNYTDVGWNPYVFSFYCLSYVMLCAIWYHLYNLKNVKKHPWRSVAFSKVAVFTKSNIPPWVFFSFFKLYKWYQIAQHIFNSYEILHRIQLSLHKKS